jgi:hypothetical protein
MQRKYTTNVGFSRAQPISSFEIRRHYPVHGAQRDILSKSVTTCDKTRKVDVRKITAFARSINDFDGICYCEDEYQSTSSCVEYQLWPYPSWFLPMTAHAAQEKIHGSRRAGRQDCIGSSIVPSAVAAMTRRILWWSVQNSPLNCTRRVSSCTPHVENYLSPKLVLGSRPRFPLAQCWVYFQVLPWLVNIWKDFLQIELCTSTTHRRQTTFFTQKQPSC